jgi:hypothetical protein
MFVLKMCVFAFFRASLIPCFRGNDAVNTMKITSKFWIGIAILAVLSPLGLLLPAKFKAGSAWGEWGVAQLQKITGYVPNGLAKLSMLWNAPMPDYAFKRWEGKSLARLSFAYIISALAGIAVISLTAWLVGKLLVKKDD